jgi:hypothetical protein
MSLPHRHSSKKDNDKTFWLILMFTSLRIFFSDTYYFM